MPILARRSGGIGASAVFWEGLSWQTLDYPTGWSQAGWIRRFEDEPPNSGALSTFKGRCAPGYRPMAWLKNGGSRWRCVREDVFGPEPTWARGSCPSGTVEYAPWARADSGLRPCRPPAELQAYPPPDPGYLVTYPPCPAGFVEAPGVADRTGRIQCVETEAHRAQRLAPWTAAAGRRGPRAPIAPEIPAELLTPAELPVDVATMFPEDRGEGAAAPQDKRPLLVLALLGLALFLGGRRR